MPVQLLLELELNLLVQNVIELEFELSRMKMKLPVVPYSSGEWIIELITLEMSNVCKCKEMGVYF